MPLGNAHSIGNSFNCLFTQKSRVQARWELQGDSRSCSSSKDSPEFSTICRMYSVALHSLRCSQKSCFFYNLLRCIFRLHQSLIFSLDLDLRSSEWLWHTERSKAFQSFIYPLLWGLPSTMLHSGSIRTYNTLGSRDQSSESCPECFPKSFYLSRPPAL